MASLDLIQEFQNKNKVEIDGEKIKLDLERVLTQYQDQKTREERIKTFAKGMYPEIANRFEHNKMTSVHYHSSEPITTTSFEFFEEYMNIMSELVKEASDHLVELSKEDAEKAKSAVEKAQKDYDDLKKEHDTAVANFNRNHPDNDRDINENSAYQELKKKYDVAKMNLDNMVEREKSLVEPVPFESTKDYFGMTGAEAKALLGEQINSCNSYMDERRSQMESVGVRYGGFMNELNNSFNDENVTYDNATAEQKRAMQEVYATKKLMNEQLQSKIGSGLFSWFRKIWYRKDISAINSYIDAANKALGKANFTEAAEKEADDAMTKQGYFHYEYQSTDTVKTIDEKFAENDRADAEMKAQENERIALEKAKEDERIALENKQKLELEKRNAEYRDSIKDQLFEIKFKPADTINDLTEQLKAFNEAKTYVDGNNNVPQNVRDVFNINGKKIRLISNNLQIKGVGVLSRIDELCKKYEDELTKKGPFDDYKPMSFDEVKNSAEIKQSMKVDLDDKPENIEVSQPIKDDLIKEKDPVAKA